MIRIFIYANILIQWLKVISTNLEIKIRILPTIYCSSLALIPLVAFNFKKVGGLESKMNVAGVVKNKF